MPAGERPGQAATAASPGGDHASSDGRGGRRAWWSRLASVGGNDKTGRLGVSPNERERPEAKRSEELASGKQSETSKAPGHTRGCRRGEAQFLRRLGILLFFF